MVIIPVNFIAQFLASAAGLGRFLIIIEEIKIQIIQRIKNGIDILACNKLCILFRKKPFQLIFLCLGNFHSVPLSFGVA